MVKKNSEVIKGLGAKYGSTVRKRYSSVMMKLKAKRQCIKCGSWSFKRLATGIWQCKKCGLKVTGDSYTL
ncbi:MAG: 50S ribosomal protein L37 [Nitrososphaerales archaeon]